ncbi:MAG: UDP-N-acetylmuramate dehydrogenase [Lachnospiraceae bacterium]|nr:UDP-N-acetylmuramate dehydrogenase [Lachnospiraceae bacterium]
MINKLKEIVGQKNVYLNEAMSKHTTFKVGGPADIFVVPQDIEQVRQVVELCKSSKENYYIIGKGSNLLVGDKGFRGIIVCMYNTLDKVEVIQDNEEYMVVAGAGVMLSKLANVILENSLTGFEFASGIPGTLGGAVAMNAGAYGGEIKDCIVEVTVLDDEGNIRTLGVSELDLSYRNSIILKKGYVVLEAKFRFEKGNYEDIKGKMLELNMKRKEKQPLEYPSAGSTFKRPEGYFAGKLIMDSGLAGFSIGGAQVSEKHCGFVINKDSATAADIIELMKQVDEIVYKNYNVHLEPEVRIIGEF